MLLIDDEEEENEEEDRRAWLLRMGGGGVQLYKAQLAWARKHGIIILNSYSVLGHNITLFEKSSNLHCQRLLQFSNLQAFLINYLHHANRQSTPYRRHTNKQATYDHKTRTSKIWKLCPTQNTILLDSLTVFEGSLPFFFKIDRKRMEKPRQTSTTHAKYVLVHRQAACYHWSSKISFQKRCELQFWRDTYNSLWMDTFNDSNKAR